MKMISVNLTVMSSSFVAASCATEGRMHTGGTEMYCHKNSSGRATLGSKPNNSQSSGKIFWNKLSTFKGLRSSTALSMCGAKSFVSWIDSLNMARQVAYVPAVSWDPSWPTSRVLLRPRNFSCPMRMGPIFLTTPLMEPQ
ncbi:BQ5605_C026g10172 [Microbotryum silenes-dioicae]|uniref:BQ5605_C026g10172 protein n=1 Tax=Microbotryum silenes-dioicae TaxID=796604 RepID=A0A2X0PMW7_9BASI|nr:BQ5605_C026g10172 [Microbotryum silenes-dioicae]